LRDLFDSFLTAKSVLRFLTLFSLGALSRVLPCLGCETSVDLQKKRKVHREDRKARREGGRYDNILKGVSRFGHGAKRAHDAFSVSDQRYRITVRNGCGREGNRIARRRAQAARDRKSVATRAAQAAAAAIAVGPELRTVAALLEADVDPVGTAAEVCCAVVPEDDVTVVVVVPLTSAASSSGFCAKNCRV
jgi:hypothetical protein